MDKTKENQNASENEIKIEMKFWEAVEITQETYNNYQENADNDLDNLNIEKLNTPKVHYKLCNKSNDVKKLSIRKLPNKKRRFKLYNKFHDKISNFSGMTYIYDNKKTNTVNVAIACRGTDLKKPIDWWQDVTMLWKHNTDSDKYAKEYAKKIFEKIINDDKYKNKEINIITLGHSKGGREAQKQMLEVKQYVSNHNKNYDKKEINFDLKYKNNCNNDNCKCKDKKMNVNICCLTFNSAPCSKEDNKKYPKQIENCQNLIVFDKINLAVDPLSYIKFIILSLILGITSIKFIVNFIIKDVTDYWILFIFFIFITLFLILLKSYKIMNYGIIALITVLSITISTIIEITKMNQLCNAAFNIAPYIILFVIVTKKVQLGKNSGNNCGYQVKWTDSLFQAHFISEFSSDSSRYKDLAKTDISKIIKVKQWKELESLADEESKKREPLTNKVNPPKND